MAIEIPGSGRTLLYDGLAQNNLDMNNFKLLNLDDSNLEFGSAPPSVHPPLNEFLHSWESSTRTWGHYPVSFDLLTGNLTLAQQRQIQTVGRIAEGIWQGSPLEARFVPRLDVITPPLASVNLNQQKIINLKNPTNTGDAVNLGYLTAALSGTGLKIKEAVKCATTTAIGLAGFPIIDGYQTVAGDRVLIKDMTAEFEYLNGIWIARSGNWTSVPNSRATDCDTADELTMAACYVLNGTLNHGTSWIETNILAVIGLGNPVHFVIFSNSEFSPPGPPGQGVPAGGTTGQFLSKIDEANYNTRWVDAPTTGIGGNPKVYAQRQTIRLSPTGTVSTDGRMMGLGQAPGFSVITPTASGKIAVHVAGWISSDNASGIAAAALRVGAVSAGIPVNGGADAGLVFGGVAIRGAIGANAAMPFSLSGVLWNLTVGNSIWLDLLVASSGTPAIAKVGDVTVTAYEIP